MQEETVNDNSRSSVPREFPEHVELDAAAQAGTEQDAADQDAPDPDPLASSVLDEDEIDDLVGEFHKESDAADQKIAALEEKLVLLCRKAIYTTSGRHWVLCEGELHALTEQLNELRYESALLPILQSVCPAATDPSNKEDMKKFCWVPPDSPVLVENRLPERGGGPGLQSPDWLPRSEKEAIWNAYMLPNAVRDRIAQLAMRCLDAKEMLTRFRGLARRLAKANNP